MPHGNYLLVLVLADERDEDKIIRIVQLIGEVVGQTGDVLLGREMLDSEDFLVLSLLLPIGLLIYLLLCVSKWGRGFDKYIAEVNKGTGIRMSPKFKPYFRWVLPILILIILVQGLI